MSIPSLPHQLSCLGSPTPQATLAGAQCRTQIAGEPPLLGGRASRSLRRAIFVCEHQGATESSENCSHNARGGPCGVPWGHLGVHSKHKNNYSSPPPAAASTVARLAEKDDEVSSWRLGEQLGELKMLRDRLAGAETLEQKMQLLNGSSRVRAVFGNVGRLGLYINPVVAFALEVLRDYDLYLLKCLVAGGQEHVLEVTPAWLEQYEEALSVEQELQDSRLQNGCNSVELNPVKDVFSMLVKVIEGWRSPEAEPGQLSSLQLLPHVYASGNPVERSSGSNASGGSKLSSNVLLTRENSHQTPSSFKEGLATVLRKLVGTLNHIETFYDSIGGIIGYQLAALELIKASEKEEQPLGSSQSYTDPCNAQIISKRFYVPKGPDLSTDKKYATEAAIWGLEGLPQMGEIYPLGGAGDRLGLVDDVTGECLPVAMLPYCGRTLLEGLIRDLQAREYLHHKVFGKQHVTPVAIMTSAAKKNNERVLNLCENRGWFGRGRENFCLFEQPLIPAVAADNGHWLISEPLTPVLKPGGHGVIWKLAHDKGVFKWFYEKGRRAAIVRQISNPIAATDVTVLALSGIGLQQKKKFGFASCERNVGAAEGVNVLIEQNTGVGWEYGVTCIEYTEFHKLGIADVPVSPGSMQAQYPANTNVLFVDLPSVECIASSQSSDSLPGMILNMKKPIVFKDYLGVTHSVHAGRIECTMQNVADFLLNKYPVRLPSTLHEGLDTFVIYNQRRKVTSSAKRRRKPNEFSLHQTPDGSFLDVTRNAHDLLSSCGVDIPKMESNQCYFDSGPPFIMLLHPALGPIWDVVRQKIQGGSIAKGSEMQLEVAEFLWKDVQLDGSLVINSKNAMGSLKKDNGEAILQYGEGCGRCRLQRVQIVNKGIDWSSKNNVYWQHKVERIETLKIILHGNAEFEAHDVKLEGSFIFEVPEGHRMKVTKANTGVSCIMEPLPLKALSHGSWYWKYYVQDGNILLTCVES